MLSGLQLTAFMFDVPLPDTYGVYQYISHSSYSSLLWLVNCHHFTSHCYRNYRMSVLALLLLPQQDCLSCAVNVHLNSGARRKLLIWSGGGGLT